MTNKNFDIKITKRTLLYEQKNDKCYNFYYDVHGRIINAERTKYKKFSFVVWFDIFDVQEYCDKDSVTKADIKDLLDCLISGNLELIKSYEDCKEFYAMCRETVEHYNKMWRAWNPPTQTYAFF